MRTREIHIISIALCLLCGCSAPYWIGDSTNQPGLEYETPGLLNGGKFKVNANTKAKIGKFQYKGKSETEPSSMSMEDAEFGMQPSDSLKDLPAMIDAAGKAQMSQVAYLKVLTDAITQWIDTIGGVVNVMSLAKVHQTSTGLQLELPGGFKLGGTKVSTPADFKAAMAAVQEQMAAMKSATSKPE